MTSGVTGEGAASESSCSDYICKDCSWVITELGLAQAEPCYMLNFADGLAQPLNPALKLSVVARVCHCMRLCLSMLADQVPGDLLCCATSIASGCLFRGTVPLLRVC